MNAFTTVANACSLRPRGELTPCFRSVASQPAI